MTDTPLRHASTAPLSRTFRVLHEDAVDSTSQWARRWLSENPLDRPILFTAGTQTAGRGRLGRSWTSPRGGLWCTLAWPASLSPEGWETGLGLRVGLATLLAVDASLGASACARAELRWPNDILLNGRKVAGALTEVISSGGARVVLIGVGVNANLDAAALPTVLRTPAASLREALGAEIDLEHLRDDLAARLVEALVAPGLSPETLAIARSRLHGVGGPARASTSRGTVTGVLEGLRDDGAPILRTAEGLWSPPPGAEIESGE